ncbi:MAG: hypothetical protein A2016_11525 [Elusimicrobia bacterium GWF2_62_30]|nr:MAG: hypothetical protein A2016_11525 [Elusimicrobia bacterium GWF2_62_30]
MEAIFLGTTGWYDTPQGSTVCTLLRTKKYDIVLDAGYGLNRLERYVDGGGPVYLFLSHFHLDHIVGLHTLVKFKRIKRLTICAGAGARRILGAFINKPFTVPLAALPYQVKVLELPAEAKKLPFSVSTLPLEHADPVLGFRFRLDGKIVTYCTDTGYCPNALKLARGADLLITECSHLPGEANPGWPHFNPETAARLAAEAGAGRLILTHFSADRYPRPADRAAGLRVARRTFPGAAAARDGLRFKF